MGIIHKKVKGIEYSYFRDVDRKEHYLGRADNPQKVEERLLEVLKGNLRPAQIFVHDHSPFAKDCNPKCGWYELGKQFTSYSPSEKKQALAQSFRDALKAHD